MPLTSEQLSEIILNANLLEKKELKKYTKEATKNKVELNDFLVNNNLVNRDKLNKLIAEFFKINYVDPSKNRNQWRSNQRDPWSCCQRK